jgi:ketosteroid isomerase-like protein
MPVRSRSGSPWRCLPRSCVLLLKLWTRLPPGSQVWRRLLKRLVVRGFEAASRDDYDFPLLFWEPDGEVRPFEEASGLGLPQRYLGHQGYRDAWADYKRDLADLRVKPQQIVDLGDRFGLRAVVEGRGRTSGVETRATQGYAFFLSSRGLVARQDLYWTWDEALAALGHAP